MKSALLVGINKYENLRNCNLRGCLNDVQILSDMLRSVYGFDRIKWMLDEDASRESILDELNELRQYSEDGDEIVFAFSGHGTQIYDVAGDETDGYDECICPADTSMDDDAALISDDELRPIFEGFNAGARLTVIMDCCHSGTNTRDMRRHINGRYLDRGIAARTRPTVADIDLPWLHLSGCRDAETSADAEFGGVANGALTYALCWALRGDHAASASNTHAKILDFLGKNGYDQHPVLNGRPDLRKRPMFGGL